MTTAITNTREIKENSIGNVIELTPEELEMINGGEFYDKKFYPNANDVVFNAKVGDIVEVRNIFYIGTVQCKITAVKTEYESIMNTGAPGIPGGPSYDGYIAMYYCESVEGHWYFFDGWYTAAMIEIPGT